MATLHAAHFPRTKKYELKKFTDNPPEPHKQRVEEDFFLCDICYSPLELIRGSMLVCIAPDCEKMR